MKAATADASSSGLQVGGSRVDAETLTQQDSMADGSRMDVEVEENDESRNSNAQNIRRRMMTDTSTEESQMDDEGEQGDEFRSSTVLNTRRRFVTKTTLEENKGDERKVAVTTQESLDGIREEAKRIASLDGLGTNSSARRGPSPSGGLTLTGPRKPKRL